MFKDKVYYVGEIEKYLFVKLINKITMYNVMTLKKFLDTLEIAKFSNLIFDFEKTSYIDSTGFGIISAAGVNFMKTHANNKIILLNLSSELKKSFLQFGFQYIGDFSHTLSVNFDESILCPLVPEENPLEVKEILEAHQNLASLNDKNKLIFKNVINLLQAEMEKN